jgi:hypothetical protein
MKSWLDLAVDPETIGALIDTVDVESDGTLHVHFSQPQTDMPYALSMLDYAVVKSSESTTWPVGSGLYRIVSVQKRSSTRSSRAVTIAPTTGAKRPVIHFVESPEAESRDLLDGLADLMVTSDPAVLAYADSRPQMSTTPLAWNQTYVLLSRSRASAIRTGETLRAVSPHLSNDLANDAVRADARPCSPPDWWIDVGDCFDSFATPGDNFVPVESSGDTHSPVSLRVIYDLNDPTARDLAERIVALAAAGPGASAEAEAVYSALPGLAWDSGQTLITAEVSSEEFERSLHDGDDVAYILSVPRRAPDACTEIRKLVGRAPWLVALGLDIFRVFIPLIDTRPHVILNGNGIGLGVDWYGHVFVLSADQNGQLE